MKQVPQNPSYDHSLQSFVLSTTTITQILVILFFSAITVFGFTLQRQFITISLLVPLALFGLIYNFFIWQRLEKRYPFESTYWALGITAFELFIVVGLTGGIASPMYPILPMVVIVSCILGLRAVVYSSFALILSIGAFLVVAGVQDKAFSLYPYQLFYSALAIIFGLLVARLINHYVKTFRVATTIATQINSSELSEKLMLSAIADPVIGVDLKQTIKLFNPSAEELTGWETKDAIGTSLVTILKLFDGNDTPMKKVNNPFLQVFAKGEQVVTDEFHILSKENQRVSFSIAVAPSFDTKGAINGAIAVFHDISAQKSLWRERNEFVSTASHEMRTPVAAIEGYLSMATNKNLASVDERALNFIAKAHESSIHLGKLFQDLLSVTKIEDNRLKDQRQVFNLSDLIVQVGSEMEIAAKKKGLGFYTRFGMRKGGEKVIAPVYNINADPERIREVLTNLVDNAIKYTPSGSIEIAISSEHDMAKVMIADTGYGIAIDEQKHMFEKFYRVSNSQTSEIGGTGLGLYITRNLIEHYGGRIWVESKPGAGSKFYFTLPLAKT